MDGDSDKDRALPVFVLNNQLPSFDQKPFTTTELCAAAEKVCGYNSIEGSQKIGNLWRIYPRNKETRQALTIQGFVLRGVVISVKTTNPYLQSRNIGHRAQSGDTISYQTPSTKLIIGNIPLSYTDTDILQAVKQQGVTVLSHLIAERDRDESGKLTHWKTGRRFVYITVPSIPLPKSLEIGPFRGSLYHKEQKKADRQHHSECRRCLTKGHRIVDCTAPIKCRQCLKDGHKAGDAESSPETTGATVQDSPSSETSEPREQNTPFCVQKPTQLKCTSEKAEETEEQKSTKQTYASNKQKQPSH
ncbi:hypothetical protein ACOMHN_015274 [Nucella lapillus]